MNFEIPKVPEHLSAQNTTDAIKSSNYQIALNIYQQCLDEIKKFVFPCRILLNEHDVNNEYIDKICSNLNNAGYNAERKECNEEKYHFDGNYIVQNIYILIDNPLMT